TGVLRGQLFAKQRGGGVVKGAGSEIILNPVTSLSLQWYDEARRGNLMSEPDPRYVAAGRTTKADAEGRFEFRNVPPGEYFVNGA
ncbi:carboxypeptidase-like regulatory domain-containing protein, partial [Klebsiella pneumoniae]|nr:carboxypeptidase-like regulatory domain-containing protein [Klebsiella pneumoniae]